MYIICAIIYFEQRNGGNFSMGEKKEALLHDAGVETAVFNYLLENKLLLMSVDTLTDTTTCQSHLLSRQEKLMNLNALNAQLLKMVPLFR